jgi:hypothetical protein
VSGGDSSDSGQGFLRCDEHVSMRRSRLMIRKYVFLRIWSGSFQLPSNRVPVFRTKPKVF